MGLRQKRSRTEAGTGELLRTTFGLLSRGGICDLAVGIHNDRSFAECDRFALLSFDFLNEGAKSGVSSESRERKQNESYSRTIQQEIAVFNPGSTMCVLGSLWLAAEGSILCRLKENVGGSVKRQGCDVQRPPCFEASKMQFTPPPDVGEEIKLLRRRRA